MLYKMPGNLVKLDQRNTSIVGIVLRQMSVIGGGGRCDRAVCRDMRQHAERWRARDREIPLLQLGRSDNRRRPAVVCG